MRKTLNVRQLSRKTVVLFDDVKPVFRNVLRNDSPTSSIKKKSFHGKENSAEMSQIEEILKQVAWLLVTLNGVGYNCLISIE